MGVLVYAGDGPSIDVLIAFLQAVLTKLDSPAVVGFEWAEVALNLCLDSPEPDALDKCGGGAVAVTKGGHVFFRTSQWLEAAKRELAGN